MSTHEQSPAQQGKATADDQSTRAKGVRFPDMDWFFANLRGLADEYPNQWLAISGQRVLAHADTAAGLRCSIEQLGLERPFIGRTPSVADLDES